LERLVLLLLEYIYFERNRKIVEESFRVKLKLRIGRMRIYQWIAIINILTGAFFTTLPIVETPVPTQ